MLCIHCDNNIPDASLLCSTCESGVEQALAHESGHAMMSLIQGIICTGICFDRNAQSFCTVSPPRERLEPWSNKDYLVSAAGVAAEKVIYGRDHVSGGAGADRKDFEAPDAPPFDEAVSEAYEILSSEAIRIRTLTSKLMGKVKALGFDFSSLPTTEKNGMQLPVLLSGVELEAAVHWS